MGGFLYIGCGFVAIAALIVFWFWWKERHIRRVIEMAKEARK